MTRGYKKKVKITNSTSHIPKYLSDLPKAPTTPTLSRFDNPTIMPSIVAVQKRHEQFWLKTCLDDPSYELVHLNHTEPLTPSASNVPK